MKTLMKKFQAKSEKTENKTSTLEQCIAVEKYLRDFESKDKISSNGFCEFIFNFSKEHINEICFNK